MTEEQKGKCTLTNEQLIAKSFEWVKKLCDTGAKAWSLQVPVNPNQDPDVIFVELGNRLSAQSREIEELNEYKRLNTIGLSGYTPVELHEQIADLKAEIERLKAEK